MTLGNEIEDNLYILIKYKSANMQVKTPPSNPFCCLAVSAVQVTSFHSEK